MITLRDKIKAMFEQYSITNDNPTVLRELLKLSVTVDTLIEEVEKIDSSAIDRINARIDKIEGDIAKLDPDAILVQINSINDEIAAIRSSVSDAKTAADNAAAAAQAADNTANSAKNAADAAARLAGEAKAAADIAAEDASDAHVMAETAEQNAQSALTGLSGKQNTLTFDDAPKEGSSNPVTSDGVFKAIQAAEGGSVTLDDNVTPDSQNGVKSSGIYSAIETAKRQLNNQITNMNVVVGYHTDDIAALQEFKTAQEETNTTHNDQISQNLASIQDLQTGKQDALYRQTSDPGNPIEYAAAEMASIIPNPDELDVSAPPAVPTLLAVSEALALKQDVLEFDNEPISGSDNPVTSNGIFEAIQSASGGGGAKIPVLKSIHGTLYTASSEWFTSALPNGCIPVKLNADIVYGGASTATQYSVKVNLDIMEDSNTAGNEFEQYVIAYATKVSDASSAFGYVNAKCEFVKDEINGNKVYIRRGSQFKVIAESAPAPQNIRQGQFELTYLDFTGGTATLEYIEDEKYLTVAPDE